MRRILGALPLAALAFGAAEASAQTAGADVSFEVQAINVMSVSSPSLTLTVNAAVAGNAPTAVSSQGQTWAITTNELARRVTGQLNMDMPSGVTLLVSMGAPAGATSNVAAPLSSTVAQELVKDISTLNQSGLALTYTLSATAAAGVVGSATRTLTYTIVE